MSLPLVDYDFWQDLWDKYAQKYLAECRSEGVQADLSGFSIWVEDNDLVGEDELWTAC